MFRRKPAITSSDWHFTAFQNSSENSATFNRSIHYNLVLERSTDFGSNNSNYPKIVFVNKSLILLNIIYYLRNLFYFYCYKNILKYIIFYYTNNLVAFAKAN